MLEWVMPLGTIEGAGIVGAGAVTVPDGFVVLAILAAIKNVNIFYNTFSISTRKKG